MKVIIIGAGLGGLSAAICFAKKTHDVQVYEQRAELSEQGSGINIRAPASRIMHNWGLRTDLESICSQTSTVLLKDLQTGAIAMRSILVDVSEHPDWGTSRRVLIKMLYDKALEAGAKINFGVNVTSVHEDSEKAYATLENGNSVSADLILAADGIKSKTRSQILSDLPPASLEPLISGTTFYGVVLNDKDVLKLEADLENLKDQATGINVWMGKDRFVVSRWNLKTQQWGGLYGIRSNTDQKAMWDEEGDIQFVRNIFAGSCKEMVLPLEMAQTCDRWKLAEMPNLPRWNSRGGRIVLLGDAAHAKHPNAAQGFSQTVEDIGVLDYLLSRYTKPAANLPTITYLWQKIRKPRVERIKEYAKWNTNLFLGEPLQPIEAPQTEIKSLKDVKPEMHARFRSSAFNKWALDYDAVGEAKKFRARTNFQDLHLFFNTLNLNQHDYPAGAAVGASIPDMGRTFVACGTTIEIGRLKSNTAHSHLPLLFTNKSIRHEAQTLLAGATFSGDFDMSKRGNSCKTEAPFITALRQIMMHYPIFKTVPRLKICVINLSRLSLRTLAALPYLYCDNSTRGTKRGGVQPNEMACGGFEVGFGGAWDDDFTESVQGQDVQAVIERLLVLGERWAAKELPLPSKREIERRVWRFITDVFWYGEGDEDEAVRDEERDEAWRRSIQSWWGISQVVGEDLPRFEDFIRRQDAGLIG